MRRRAAAGRDTARRDTVRRRLRRLIGMLLALIAIVGAGGLAATAYATHTVSQLADGYGPASDDTSDALAYMLQLQSTAGGYLLSADAEFLSVYAHNGTLVRERIDDSKTRLDAIGDHTLDARIDRERRLADRWLQTYAMPIAADPDASAGRARHELGEVLFDRFRAANAVVLDSLRTTRTQQRADTLRLRDTALYAIGAVALLAVAVASLFGLRMVRGLAGPLAALSRTVSRIGRGELSARADTTRGPAEVRAVAGAVNLLGAEVEAADRARMAADRLREGAQPLSESLRLGVDPVSMTRGLVVGLGPLFDVDRAWVHTFGGGTVPGMTVQWHSPHVRPLPEPVIADPVAFRDVVTRVWHGPGLVAVDDLSRYEPGAAAQRLVAAVRAYGARASVFAAIGDRGSVLGVLGMSHCGGTHRWGATELAIVNRICAELANSLVQGGMLARQQAVIAQLRELDEAKSTLVSTVSHELRTPLTSITGYVELALEGAGGPLPAEAESMLRVAERNVARLRALIEDLLTQSRIDAGRLRVSASRVDLHDIVSDVAASMAPIAQAHGVALRCTVPAPGELCVDGDQRQLEQAMTNLAANAVKFTSAGGEVQVTAAGDVGAGAAGRVRLQVQDTGIGIPEGELPRLFDRFYRASNASAAAIPGTGLGLSIVREIVHAHGGELGVESALGRGTTVTISLPRSLA